MNGPLGLTYCKLGPRGRDDNVDPIRTKKDQIKSAIFGRCRVAFRLAGLGDEGASFSLPEGRMTTVDVVRNDNGARSILKFSLAVSEPLSRCKW